MERSDVVEEIRDEPDIMPALVVASPTEPHRYQPLSPAFPPLLIQEEVAAAYVDLDVIQRVDTEVSLGDEFNDIADLINEEAAKWNFDLHTPLSDDFLHIFGSDFDKE